MKIDTFKVLWIVLAVVGAIGVIAITCLIYRAIKGWMEHKKKMEFQRNQSEHFVWKDAGKPAASFDATLQPPPSTNDVF